MFKRKNIVMNMHERVMFFLIFCFYSQAENEGERD